MAGKDSAKAARLAVVSIGVLAVAGGAAMVARKRMIHPQSDSAPGRTARRTRFGNYAVTGRSVTINRPREEIFALWRDFSNLPRFMENVVSVSALGDDVTRWVIKAPAGATVNIDTRIVAERPGEEIAWQSVPSSQIGTRGKVMFHDALDGRGTVVEAIIAYKPPLGEAGRLLAKLAGREPAIQGRRELKRLKMLLETGEIATARRRNDQSEGDA
jgi:uncharacterized membrane protein